MKTKQNVYCCLFSSRSLSSSFCLNIRNYLQHKAEGLERASGSSLLGLLQARLLEKPQARFRASLSWVGPQPLKARRWAIPLPGASPPLPTWSRPDSRSTGPLPSGPPQLAPPTGQSLFFTSFFADSHDFIPKRYQKELS